MDEFAGLWYECEECNTSTTVEQCSCERTCATFLRSFTTLPPDTLEKLQYGNLVNNDHQIRLLRGMHVHYLMAGLSHDLPSGFVSLEPSRSWICYWIMHALNLLDAEPTHLYHRLTHTLARFQNKTGGFGGGIGHISQCAPNYGAVLALCTIGTDEALSVINRAGMYNFFLSMKQSNGGFSIHRDGEVDTRGTYTVIAISRILNILTDEMKDGVADFVLSCQSYEGGFGGEPHNEAHGGYNFCAVATLHILGELHRCDTALLESWLLRRQMRLEGGFQGRTNKLVDSCYSFWQGAALAILAMAKNGGGDIYDLEQYLNMPESISADGDIDFTMAPRIHQVTSYSGTLSFNQKSLQKYILQCAQSLEAGGMRDKPGKSRDFYHSCYALSGLSIAQSCITAPSEEENNEKIESNLNENDLDEMDLEDKFRGYQVYGDFDNLLKPTSVIFNIGLEKLKIALEFYGKLPSSHQELISLYATSQITP
eukprot:gene5976-8231_t